MSLFRRKSVPATKARTTRAIKLKLTEFEAALEAARALGVGARQVSDLMCALESGPDGQCVVSSLPADIAALLEALEELASDVELGAAHRSTLRRARELLLQAEAAADREDRHIVSERVLAALLRVPLDRLAEHSSHFSLSRKDVASVRRLAALAEEMQSLDSKLQRQHAQHAPRQPWSTI